MTTFLVIYIVGFIISLALLIYNEPQYVTIGDLTKFLFMSVFSWIVAVIVVIEMYNEIKDKGVIRKGHRTKIT